MKNILYIHQYFKTPTEGGAIRSYHIAKGMVDRGMKVEIITSHNKSKYEKKTIDEIIVHYLPIPYSNKFSSWKRYLSFLNFVFAALKYSKTIANTDLVFATSTPLTVGIIALWLKWKKKVPYIFEVRDLWPEAPIQLGFIRSPFLIIIIKRLEKIIYKNAWKIVALSPGIANGIQNRYSHPNIIMIPNMADVDFFYKKPTKIHEKNEFSIGYFGAFGLANNLEFILDLAKECQKARMHVDFLLVGKGAKEQSLVERIEKLGLQNVKILPFQNRFEIRASLQEVDACITSFLNIPILETNSPNKFFDGLAAGKLSIVNTKGWLKDLVEKHKCGIYQDPNHLENFPTLILPFIQDKLLLKTYQENGSRLAREAYLKEKLVGQACELLQ
jgi:glycosyltransferase involved in cell wall biosynthesis